MNAPAAQGFHQSFLDSDSPKNKPRNKRMVKMAIVVRDCAYVSLPGANVVGVGASTISVYEDEVGKIKQMVERDNAMIEQAKESYRLTIAEEVAKQVDGFKGTAEEMADLIDSKSNLDVESIVAKVRATTITSWQGEFRKLAKRDVLPLSSAEVVPNSEHVEPHRKAVADDVQALGKEIAGAITEAVRASSAQKR